MGASCHKTSDVARTAKSCGPDARNAGVKSLRGQRLSGAMVARSSDSPGRARISRKAIAQGRPECFRFTCMLVCAFPCASMHTRPRVQRAPGLPCALCLKRARTICKTSDKACRENANACLLVVPANAGTHTPCRLFLENAADALLFQPMPGVMGPRVRGDDNRGSLVAPVANPELLSDARISSGQREK